MNCASHDRDRTMGSFACATSRPISAGRSCKPCWRAQWCRSGVTEDDRTIDHRTTRPKVMGDYTKIEAWRLADDLTVSVYEYTQSLPKEEIYGLTSQIRRAASSVPANIVEGALRGSKKDYLHFLWISRGLIGRDAIFCSPCSPT